MSSTYTEIPATQVPQREHEPDTPQHEGVNNNTSTLEDQMKSHLRAAHRNARRVPAASPGRDQEPEDEEGNNQSQDEPDEDDYQYLSPKKLFDQKPKVITYAHATSGLEAMRAIAAESSSVEKVDHQCTGYIISAVPINISDRGIFERNERKISMASEMVNTPNGGKTVTGY
jgi:hypothetical protein